MSKQLAYDIARKLTEKLRNKIDKLETELGRFVKAEYEKQIPKQIKKLAITHPGWIEWTDEVRLHGHGFNYKKINFCLRSAEKELPRPIREEAELVLTDELADEIKKRENVIGDLVKKKAVLLIEIQAALLGLSTFARIQEKFPEAVKFIPISTSRAIAVNMDSLRDKIKTA